MVSEVFGPLPWFAPTLLAVAALAWPTGHGLLLDADRRSGAADPRHVVRMTIRGRSVQGRAGGLRRVSTLSECSPSTPACPAAPSRTCRRRRGVAVARRPVLRRPAAVGAHRGRRPAPSAPPRRRRPARPTGPTAHRDDRVAARRRASGVPAAAARLGGGAGLSRGGPALDLRGAGAPGDDPGPARRRGAGGDRAGHQQPVGRGAAACWRPPTSTAADLCQMVSRRHLPAAGAAAEATPARGPATACCGWTPTARSSTSARTRCRPTTGWPTTASWSGSRSPT